ncbi:mannitol dehydrogenase family protein [Endozoicomonas arenosclerae]|uniref:mannitol dehydrogenase family protein n=1 Tax=Endozoicomonas arenosclerae TaxID=1633495 RepID=UPI0007833EFD|nr:mannitol dehydrogenase family protein [Endozoicomonas arenosclerae]
MNSLNSRLTIAPWINGFTYDRRQIKTGIVHLGLGAFHRAHQALYTCETMSAGDERDWGICAANIRSNVQLVETLNQQDNLYSVTEWDAGGQHSVSVCGALTQSLFSRKDPQPLLEQMVQPETRIVSLSITEKGYYLDPANGKLLKDEPDILHDVQYPEHPVTAMGFIIESLKRRREANIPPFTVLSCDNIPENGQRSRLAVTQLAQQVDAELAEWIDQHVAFPSSMVDRIVPAVTEKDLSTMADQNGFLDSAAVATESFRQWIIEDHFPLGRPDWDLIDGAEFVEDVRPYEQMKLRMLNGSHSFLAYLGYLAGYQTIGETIQQPDFRLAAKRLLCQEAMVTLDMPEEVDLESYAEQLLERFSNPCLKHKTQQVASDGSQKIPQRWLNSVQWHLDHNASYDCLALGIAGWIRYISGKDISGEPIEVSDPLSEHFQQLYQQNADSPEKYLSSILELETVFGQNLSKHSELQNKVSRAYQTLNEIGAEAAVGILAKGGSL